MRLGHPVRAQPMAVETPSQRWLCLERTRAGHTVKLQATSAKRGDDMVAHTKRRPDGTILYIEELPAGKNRLAMLSMGPGAKDFASIAQSLLSNAQSDAGDACSAYPKPGDAQRFSRGAKQAAPAPAPGTDPEAEESAQALNDALVQFGLGADGRMPMKRLPCLTLFLESGKKFKLPSGETFDQLRQPQPSSTSSTAPTSRASRKRSASTSPANPASTKSPHTHSGITSSEADPT